jgi:DNA-binding Lrp family transcriptional regulator
MRSPLWRKGGTRPDRPSKRIARSSATSMMIASSGSRSQMNDTTHPSHAGVCCIEQSSQLIVSEVMAQMIAGGCDAGRSSRKGARSRRSISPDYPLAMVHAFVLIDAEPARVADLSSELADLEGVAEVYSVAGHADIVAVVRVRRHEELADVVTRGISRRPGVLDTRTLIAFQSFSRHDLEAVWDLGPGD